MELIIITGNIAQDSEVTHVTKTRSVCNFTVAVNKRFRDKRLKKPRRGETSG